MDSFTNCDKEPCGVSEPYVRSNEPFSNWFIGRYCSRCELYSRDSGYYWTADDARDALESGEYGKPTWWDG
jgi:hypothetical protein